MSNQSIQNYGKGFLVILLPISFLFVFLVTTWRFWLGFIALLVGFNLFQRYRWVQWCERVNPLFNKLVQENQGRIAPMDLAVKGNFSGGRAKRYLDTKASEFGATILSAENGSKTYYFITSSVLGSILDSSEPPKELAPTPLARASTALLAPPVPKHQEEKLESFSPPTEVKFEPSVEAKPETEAKIEPIVEVEPQTETSHAKVETPLEKQLVFGSLIQSELAKRLNVYSSTIYKRRNDPDFAEWSRNRDPDGIAWRFSRRTKEFFPLEKGEKA